MQDIKNTFIIPRKSFFFPGQAVSIGTGPVDTRYKKYLESEFKKLIDLSFEHEWKGPTYEGVLLKLRAFVKGNEVFIKQVEGGMTEQNIRLVFTNNKVKPDILAALGKGFFRFFTENSKTISELSYVVAEDQVDVPIA